MNKRQKKKIMKKYVIKSNTTKKVAYAMLKLANGDYPYPDYIGMIAEIRLTEWNYDYQNELYGRIVSKYPFSTLMLPLTLAEIHRNKPEYDYHMKLKIERRNLDKEIEYFISKLSKIIEIASKPPISFHHLPPPPLKPPAVISFTRGPRKEMF